MLALLVPLLSCSSEDAPDCIQTAGKTVEVELELDPFTQIRTETDVRLVLKEGDRQRVVLETGKNLVSDIRVEVVGGILSIENTKGCNLVRDYGITKLTVTAPNISEVRNGSSHDVRSEGVLHYPSLSLISTSTLPDGTKVKNDGDFDMEIDNDRLRLVAGGSSFFKIKGKTNYMDVYFFDGSPRLEAEEFLAKTVDIYNRGANKMIINPQKQLKGIITGTGDVISITRPPVVMVEERFKGRLIFKDDPL